MSDSVVLTSETPEATAAFYASRLGLEAVEPTEAAEAEPVVESTPEKKPEPAEGKGGEQPQAQPPEQKPPKIHVRFSELTEQANVAKAAEAKALADLATERQARVLAEQRAEELRAKHEPPKDPLGPEPTRAQFVNDEEFAVALKEHTEERVTRDIEEKGRRQGLQKQWEAREAVAKAAIPDYDATIAAGADLKLPNPVIDAIASSEQGPWIVHHLAANPDVVGKIATMTPEARLLYIGKLEGKFEAQNASAAPATEKPAAAKPAVAAASEISRAPAPISPLKGGSAIADSPIDSNGVYHGTADEWRALRKAGKIK